MTDKRTKYRRAADSIQVFSQYIIGVPLYPYQSRCGQYIMDVLANRRNETIIVEMSRQAGKNQLQSTYQIAALAHFCTQDRSIVASAPTAKPQLINSKMRFASLSERAMQRHPNWLKYKPAQGYIFRCRRASIHFLSADPSASVVGATASLMLNVDEAQDTNEEAYSKRFSPMRASTNAPVVMFGTTWDTNNIFAKTKRSVLEGRARGRIFRVLPEEIALSNPAYGEFVDSEVRARGRDHPYIRTQYYLEELDTAGRMLTPQQLELMVGNHPRQAKRNQEPLIVAGLDFAGADEQAGELVSMATASARDSVALTIGAVTWVKVADGITLPSIRVLNRYEWVNVNPVTLHNQLYEILWGRWRVNLVCCDATGIGATGTALLAKAINKEGQPERVRAITFDSAWNKHTEAAFGYLSAINNGHFKDYQPQGFDPLDMAGRELPPKDDPHAHVWWQRGQARLEAKPSRRVRMYVPEDQGHDDLLYADGLLVLAAQMVGQPQTMTGANVDFYQREVGGVALPEPVRSAEEIERMLG